MLCARILALIAGLGLGLPICMDIIEAMGGTIGLNSIVGEGSTFHFSLPIPKPKRNHDNGVGFISASALPSTSLVSAPTEASSGGGSEPTTDRTLATSSAPMLSHSDPISSVTTENTVSHGSREGRGGSASSSAPFESHTCDYPRYIGSHFILSHDIQLCQEMHAYFITMKYTVGNHCVGGASAFVGANNTGQR